MSESAGQRTPTLETDWEDLTENHRELREGIETSIEQWPEEITQATYVIGAIGAGKTQLLTHLYKYAYASAGKPALYVTMGQLLDDVEDKVGYPEETDVISQEQLHEVMEDIVDERRERFHSALTDNVELGRGDYLLDWGRVNDLDEYIDILDVTRDELEELTTHDDEVILIVDEMEESYNRLGEMVAQTTGPLREVVERVERGNSNFYLIGGFGYASVHELGEAEYRRVNPVTLPIIKPQSVQNVLGDGISIEQRNFVWWMSRGRPGWLEIANNAFGMQPTDIRGTYDALGDIPNLAMSRVDIIALEELEEYVEGLGELERDQAAYTIYHPTPTKIEDIPGLAGDDFETTNAPVLTDTSLVDLDDIATTFLEGARRTEYYNEAVVSDQLVRRYLVRILRAISTQKDTLVFGAAHASMFKRGNICKDRMLAPLAERIHDIALEETGEEEQETVDYLYELLQYIQRTGAEELSGDFAAFFDLFTQTESSADPRYLGPGLRTLVTVFPSLITNPRLNFAGTGQTVTEQFDQLVSLLADDGAANQLYEFGALLQEDPR